VLTRIVVRRGPGGFHAWVESKAEFWAVGTTHPEAVGNLVLGYPEVCGVDPGVRDVRDSAGADGLK
jgi:hypothetical protein